VASGVSGTAVVADHDGTGPWMRSAEFLVPFTGGAGHFRRVSAVDVLRDRRVDIGLRGSFVLVGATAPGLQRDFATPVSGLGQPLTSVEVHANVLDALRQGLGIRDLAWPGAMALTTVPLLLAVLAYARVGARRALLVTALLLLLVAAAALLLLHGAQLWLPPTPALLAVLLSFPLYAWRRIERTAHALAAEQQKGRATLHSIGDAVITTDSMGRVTFANPQAERISGLTNEQIRGRPLADALQFTDPAERDRFAAVLEHCSHGAASAPPGGQMRIRNPQGKEFHVRVSASPVQLPGGRFDGTVLALTDVSESVAMTRLIAHQATHDSLTTLPNRTLLVDRLEHAIATARRANAQVAVLFLDLDDFKRVNDGLGHAVGDALLREVAQRLSSGSRANDTIARWGGDEFLVVAEETSGTDAAARVARKLLDRLAMPFMVLGNELHISGSIGISLYPGDGLDPQTLVQNADRAMYRAKHQGGNRVQFFSESINQSAHDRRQIEAGLRSAIARAEFELHYQPQIDLGRCTVSGAEVLLRWRHPQAGLLLPDRFISVAEENGLIHEIGAWVLHAACQRSAAWRDAGLPQVPLSINVSPRQLLSQELVSALGNILAETRLDPAALVLEITESATMHDIDRVAAMLHEVRALGVRISIDDFGTGYSSLSLLRRLPLEQIKIDRSFVVGVADDPGDAAITRGVIAMARGMGIKVVAEGVESAAQLAFLREHACDMAQGNYISPPLPEAQFLEMLREMEGPAGEMRARLLDGLVSAGTGVSATRH
jgi:diguanylate cyclase (GGDEF)-like protein/PAS domain S-box-containing protein